MSLSDWDECFLLHQRSFGETSLIAEVFSKNNGKMSLMARGAKKPKSKFFGYLTPFTKLQVTYSGRSDMKTLTNIDRDFSTTTNSFSKTSYSLLYINELLMRLLPKDAAQEDLFFLYEEFLHKVARGDELEITLRHFELDLLDMQLRKRFLAIQQFSYFAHLEGQLGPCSVPFCRPCCNLSFFFF